MSYTNIYPTYLTEEGQRLLAESGLRRYIDGYGEHFVDCIEHSHTNPEDIHDIENASIDFFTGIELDPDFDEELRDYSIQSKRSLKTLRQIGGIYLRDLVLDHIQHPDRPRELIRVQR